MKFLTVLFFSILLTLSLNASDLKKVSLQLQWKYQFQFAGYIMAKEKGFYKDVGLDVDIKEWKHPLENVDELLNNHAQYAILRPTALVDISKGKELVFLAAIFQSSPLVLLADKSSNISSIKEFKNKKMMSTGDMHADASLLSMMFSQGLKIEEIEIIQPSFDVKDLLNKKTDLISSYISNEPFILKENGGTPVIFNPKDYGYDFYNDMLSVSKEYMDKNKEEVEKFKNATLKGWEYAFANIDETVAILYSKYNSQNKSKDALTYEAHELKKLAYMGTAKIGLIEKEKLAKIYDVYKLLGMVKHTINYNKIIYNSVSNELELTPNEKEYLKNKEKIKVCIDPNWMPFEQFDENGKHAGMTSDYYKLFEHFLSTPFEVISSKTWTESLELAQKRECDILSLVTQTPERKKYLNFTTAYISAPLVIATKLDHSFVSNVDDLKGQKIGITKGDAYAELLKNKYQFLNLIEIKNLDEGLKKVESGEIDGYVDALSAIAYAFQQEYDGELKIAGKFDETGELGIGVRNDDAMLLSILQKTVNNLKEDQRKEILNKWISIKVENKVDYELFWQVSSFGFLIFLISLYVNYKSKIYITLLEEKEKELQRISITDGLTSIFNRRHFDEIFPKIINSAKRKSELLCFLLLDIDHFKLYNDNYGHQGGDDVLIAFANCLKTSLKRADDLAFRVGGEEFGIVFKSETKQKALEFANKVRQNIEELQIKHEYNCASKYVTASSGLVCKNAKEINNMDEIYKQADELLYKAKASGRNKVCIQEDKV
jgi:polar amino acid transport system substrate-binding protein